MAKYWYLDRTSDEIKYAGSFLDYDDCDRVLSEDGIDPGWIFQGEPKIKTNKRKYVGRSNRSIDQVRRYLNSFGIDQFRYKGDTYYFETEIDINETFHPFCFLMEV